MKQYPRHPQAKTLKKGQTMEYRAYTIIGLGHGACSIANPHGVIANTEGHNWIMQISAALQWIDRAYSGFPGYNHF